MSNHTNNSDPSLIPSTFTALLNNCNNAQKKAMLIALQNSLNSDFTYNRSSNINFNDYVEVVKDFVSGNFLDEALMAEVESLGLCMNSTKPLTQWLSCDDRPYCFSDKSNQKHDSEPISNYPAICQLMDLVNSDARTTQDANAALVIVYNKNRAGIDFHDDGETLIDSNSSITTVTFGSPRLIDFCDHTLRPRVAQHSVVCDNHDMMIMKPGCQKTLVHRVGKGITSSESNSNSTHSELRVVISFRKITGVSHNVDPDISLDLSPISTPADTSTITVPPPLPQRVTIIAGDSFVVGLNVERLGRNGRKTVVNLAKGGATIDDVSKQIESYYMSFTNPSETPVVDKVIICVGTNDIRNCKENGVRHLKRPLISLTEKLKLIFPDSIVWFQSLIPLIVQNQFSVTNVNQFNKLLFEVCTYMKIYYLNVFSNYLAFDHERKGLFRNEYYFISSKNIHLNRIGLGLLARSYIRLIHSSRFNPLGY